MSKYHPRAPQYLRKRPTVGVITGWQVYTGVMDSFLDNVFHGVLAGASQLEFNVMLACGTGSPYSYDFGKPAWPLQAHDMDFVPVGPWNCDGLIFIHPFGLPERAHYAVQLAASGYPVVFTAQYPGAAAVTVDNRGGIYQAMDHLVAHGRRKIAFIAGNIDLEGDTHERLQAYLDSLQRHNIAYNPDLVANGFHTIDGGKDAVEQILARKAPFDALVGSNDMSSIGAVQALQAAGIHVPQDVAVIGFDDRIDARAEVPMLSTIHFPMFDIGFQAVELLSQYIDKRLTEPQTVRIPTRMVARESCGCLPGVRLEERSVTTARDTSPEIYPIILREVNVAVTSESHRLVSHEVDYLCSQLVDAFQHSLQTGNPQLFAQTFHQILARVASQEDDLFYFNKVVAILREWLPAMLETNHPSALTHRQAEEMLYQALFAIAEMSQGQKARQMVRLETILNQTSMMSNCFFNAQSETEIFDELLRRLPNIGIAHAAMAYYVPEGDDPYGGSELQVSPLRIEQQPALRRFSTYQFPPENFYPPGQTFRLAVLPIQVPGVGTGFVALDAGNLQSCATVTQQLATALRSIHLYREAVAARQVAEQGKQLAEEANRVKNRFLSWVIHELRTPLNLIYGLSDMLVQESQQSKAAKVLVDREDIDRIHLSAEHLIRLIRDVLDLASSELGQLKLACEPLNLQEEIQSTASIGQQMAAEKGLGWRVDIEGSLPMVKADRTRLRQVLLNLLSNAIKFTTSGEVVLKASASGERVTVTISDTGLGIPKNEQVLIFKEFSQSARTSERGFGGLGLGLAITKRLVELHGGEIGVHSSGEVGHGSTFFFSLPVLETPAPSAGEMELTTSQLPKMFLMISDLARGDSIKTHLQQEGYAVKMHLIQDDSEDWFPLVLLEQPQAIVLDLRLASQWGWEILKSIKENPLTHDMPVLFCSMDEENDSGALIDIEYMNKPVCAADLARVILSQGALNNRHGEQTQILIVDDDPEILNMHARMVHTQFPTCETLMASNGLDALRLIHQRCPDLVLLDLLMPEMDGFTMLKMMQENELHRNIPVVVLTGQALTDEDMERLNYGVASVLSKGMYSANETLLHLSDALFRRRKAGSETQRIVLKAMAYLHTNYSAQITRQDMAQYVGLSERHLTRCFNLELGVTPMTYLNRYRILQAKILLELGRDSIAEIASKVGFSSGSYFTRVFQEEVGVLPRDYGKGKRNSS